MLKKLFKIVNASLHPSLGNNGKIDGKCQNLQRFVFGINLTLNNEMNYDYTPVFCDIAT